MLQLALEADILDAQLQEALGVEVVLLELVAQREGLVAG